MRAKWTMLPLLAMSLPLWLTGCGDYVPSQRDQAEAACRAQAEAADRRVNRLDMTQRDTSTTPLSAGGVPGINTAPLVERSVNDTEVNNCLNGKGDLPVK